MADNRVAIPFRLKPAQREKLDALAGEYGLDRATVIRAHLAVASRHGHELRQALEVARDA